MPRPWGDTGVHLGSLHRLPPPSSHSPLTLLPISCWYRAKGNLLEGTPASRGSALHEVCQPYSPLLLLSVLSLVLYQCIQLTRPAHTVHGKVHARTKCRDECVLLSIQQQESSGTEVLSGRMGNWIPFQCLNNKFILSKLISSQPSPRTQRYFNQLRAK